MDRAFEVILAAVHATRAPINQFLGDGVMALFGAPIAHEDHAHRALRAALAIQDGLEPLRERRAAAHGVEFRMRMGINTGPVVVGAIGADLRMDYTAVGDTTNLAARLLSVAKPGQIVVSEQHPAPDRRLSSIFEDLGEFQVKGKTEPVRAYAVSARDCRAGRGWRCREERGLTPLVGRDRELNGSPPGFRQAAAGEGAIVLLDRRARASASRGCSTSSCSASRGTGVLELEATCVSYGRSMAYRPILELLRRYLGLAGRA